jgi:hypothetical protein
MAESPGHLRGKMTVWAQDMRTRFDQIRRRHRGEQGRQREDVVRDFFKDLLPGRLEIGTGEIAATNGDVSPQMDLIVYDGLHTALLDRTDSSVVVPVEGVYAVTEVASNLTATKLRDDAEKIRRAKSLPKLAYFNQGPRQLIRRSHTMWGREFDYFPVLGFCFGYDSAELQTLKNAVEELDNPDDPAESVDMVCSLSRGCIMNGEPYATEEGVSFRNLSAVPTPHTVRVGASVKPGDDQGIALMHFYLLAGGLMAQAETAPIRMAAYMDA